LGCGPTFRLVFGRHRFELLSHLLARLGNLFRIGCWRGNYWGWRFF
jgi:hypothetical protein